MTTLLLISFLIWLVSAAVLALDIALPKPQPVRIRARRDRHRR